MTENSYLRTYEQNANPRKGSLVFASLISGFVTVVVVILLVFYLGGGGLSYIKRAIDFNQCSKKKGGECLRNLNLSEETLILAESINTKNSNLATQNVVYWTIRGNELWTWSLASPFKKFFIDEKTTYGVAAWVNEKRLSEKELSFMLGRGLLKSVDRQSFGEETMILLIESNPGSLTRTEFLNIVKAGYLIKVIYDPAIRMLTGIVILDLSRI